MIKSYSFCIKYISGLIITSVVAFLNIVGYWNNWMVDIVSFVGCSTLSRFEDLRQRGSRWPLRSSISDHGREHVNSYSKNIPLREISLPPKSGSYSRFSGWLKSVLVRQKCLNELNNAKVHCKTHPLFPIESELVLSLVAVISSSWIWVI